MISKLIIFEDSKKDQALFRKAFKGVPCELLFVGTYRLRTRAKEILNFRPQAAIVDAHFDSEVDGADIVSFMQKHLPKVPIVVCSVLYDMPTKRDWLLRTYKGGPGVRAVIGKTPFPKGMDILNVCS